MTQHAASAVAVAGPAAPGGLPGWPEPGRCLVMGVVAVAPAEFPGGGKAFRLEQAVARGMELMQAGADIIEVAGGSPHRGAALLPLAEEQRRVLPVVAALAGAGALVSIGTVRARVAEAAAGAGARMVNDVSGGLADPGMLRAVAGLGVAYVLTPGPGVGAVRPPHTTVAAQVTRLLAERAAAACAAGIAVERLVADPGAGLARTEEQNWQLLARLGEFRPLGRPILVSPWRRPLPGRPAAVAAIAVLAAQAGAWCVRTADAAAALDAVRVAAAVREQSPPLPPPPPRQAADDSAAAPAVHVQ